MSKELQNGNGCYAFNASFREIARIFASRLRSEALRTIPHSHWCRGSVLTRHQNVKTLHLRWRTDNAQMRITLHD